MEWTLAAAASSLVVVLLALGGAAVRVDNLLYDLLARAAAHAPSADIVVVAIDDRSIRELGRWPWPRERHAALLRRLAEARPKAIAYDVLFIEPDSDPRVDADLAAAVKAAHSVVLPIAFDIPGENGEPFRLATPVDPIRSAAAGLGQVDLQFDPDGVVRRVMLAEDDGRTLWPHLMEAVYRQAKGGASPIWSAGAAVRPPGSRGLYRSRPMIIPYTGPPGRFRTIAFSDLLRGETPDVFLRDKIVLVGATASGLGDRYATPMPAGQEVMPGVEVQANVLDALLSGRAVRPLPAPLTAAASLVPLWLLLAGFLVLRPRANMVLGVGLVLATLAISAAALAFGRLWIPPAPAILGMTIVYPLWSWRRLEAASAYMIGELERFAEEPEILPALATGGRLGGDVVAREVRLMRDAITRMRGLRRFVADALQALPDATLVVDSSGRVSLANRAAQALIEPVAGPPRGRLLTELLAGFAVGEGEGRLQAGGRDYELRREALVSAEGEGLGEIVRLADVSTVLAAARQREQVLQLLTHDMRSPQASILALLDSPGDEKPPPALARRIAAYAGRTLALADGFVQLARAESAELGLEVVSLGDLLIEAADELWPQASAKGVQLAVDAEEAEVLIRADRSLIGRALVNLVGNAVKYTPTGGRVACQAWREGGQAVCRIADTGPGMAQDQVERLFERFRRGAGGRDGAGLGLALVRIAAERHGATLTCESAPGQGAAFTLRFTAANGPGV